MTQELTPQQIQFFEENGYVGPFTALPKEAMPNIREHINTKVINHPSGFHRNAGQCRHFDDETVWQLCKNPHVLSTTQSLLGPNIVLWRSNFFAKPPGGVAVPWHQDGEYWPLDPQVNITAWLAIDPATKENSCVRVIPGSHKHALPHIIFDEEERKHNALRYQVDLSHVDESKAIDIELKPGEFFLFNEKTLHYSPPNHSDKHRLGLAIRMTAPQVNVNHDKVTTDHYCVLLSGEDTHQLNTYGRPFES